jgi:Fic family protein
MSFHAEQPYNALPALPPAGVDLETKAVLKQVIATTRALAELKWVSDSIPNPAVLLRWVTLQEAKLSSEIENIFTTDDALYQAMTQPEPSSDPAVKEVQNYQRALWHGVERLSTGGTISTRLFIELFQIIKERDESVRKTSGTRIVDGAGRTVYTPPQGEAVIRDKLADLERFLHNDDSVDPLVKLALLHYQFEAIHPFSDGNGRTGRILNLLYLMNEGLLDQPILYLSKYIIERKSDYYRLLREVTEHGRYEAWILYLLQAVEHTALETKDRVLEIRALMIEASADIRQHLPGVYSKELVDLIFSQPYCRIANVERANIAKRQTASRYLRALEQRGWLQAQEVGREQVFINTRFMEVLRR